MTAGAGRLAWAAAAAAAEHEWRLGDGVVRQGREECRHTGGEKDNGGDGVAE